MCQLILILRKRLQRNIIENILNGGVMKKKNIGGAKHLIYTLINHKQVVQVTKKQAPSEWDTCLCSKVILHLCKTNNNYL